MSYKKPCPVPCTRKWHPINSNRILLGLAVSAGVGQSLNPESSPPFLLKAFSLMTLQRWGKVAAQKDLESKGGIDPGAQPSSLSLTPASSRVSCVFLSPLFPFTSIFVSLSICFLSSFPHLFKSLSLFPAHVMSGLFLFSLMLGSDVPGQRSQEWVATYNFLNTPGSEETTQSTLPGTK